MKRTLTITIEVEPGKIEASLAVDGTRIQGHGDPTGTLHSSVLVGPLVREALRQADNVRDSHPVAHA